MPQSLAVPEVEVRVKVLPLTATEYALTHWKKLTALQASVTDVVSKAMEPEAVVYPDVGEDDADVLAA